METQVICYDPNKRRVLQRRILPDYERHFGHELSITEKPPIAVFDIDGTLFEGKSPRHALIKWYKTLPCEIAIVTARYTSCEQYTLGQLAKHGIVCKMLFTMPPSYNKAKEGVIERFKQDCRLKISEEHDIVLSVGDRWHDIHRPPGNVDNIGDSVYCIGAGFIKLPAEVF